MVGVEGLMGVTGRLCVVYQRNTIYLFIMMLMIKKSRIKS